MISVYNPPMQTPAREIPCLLAIGGHDPSGGAGIQADIEAAAANGCHCTSAITCITFQDSCNVRALAPLPAQQVIAQVEAVLADCRIGAIKIGLLGSAEIALALAERLSAQPEIPLVLDPVLAAGGGTPLANEQLLNTIRQRLLPLTTLITPNSPEARRLAAGPQALARCATKLLQQGTKAVLITGTHEASDAVINSLYLPDGQHHSSSWPRLPDDYHGSGCTLASACAARLARGEPLQSAVDNALEFTWQSLRHSFRNGRCQAIPDRLYRLDRGQTDA
jgi:hydroxymethylpyrimidine/phosphomethylpyrimidine kinase